MTAAKQVDPARRWNQGHVPRFGLAIAFVGLGLAIIWFTKRVIGVTGDALFVAELFVAVLIFLILSGQVSELTAGELPQNSEESQTTASSLKLARRLT